VLRFFLGKLKALDDWDLNLKEALKEDLGAY
jgi:hypothetical protein